MANPTTMKEIAQDARESFKRGGLDAMRNQCQFWLARRGMYVPSDTVWDGWCQASVRNLTQFLEEKAKPLVGQQ